MSGARLWYPQGTLHGESMMPSEFCVDRVGMELLTKYPKRFGTILADPPWRFANRTGKMAPEHRRLSRYATMSNDEIMELPIPQLAAPCSHLYLWVPNALIQEGLEVMRRWGFVYKTMIVWYKVRKDGGPDGRGVGFYFRNVTELVLFGIRGRLRTGPAGRRQTNIMVTQKRAHSMKPDELYEIIEACSPGPYLEMFARFSRAGWSNWGDEADTNGQQIKVFPTYRGNGLRNRKLSGKKKLSKGAKLFE